MTQRKETEFALVDQIEQSIEKYGAAGLIKRLVSLRLGEDMEDTRLELIQLVHEYTHCSADRFAGGPVRCAGNEGVTI